MERYWLDLAVDISESTNLSLHDWCHVTGWIFLKLLKNRRWKDMFLVVPESRKNFLRDPVWMDWFAVALPCTCFFCLGRLSFRIFDLFVPAFVASAIATPAFSLSSWWAVCLSESDVAISRDPSSPPSSRVVSKSSISSLMRVQVSSRARRLLWRLSKECLVIWGFLFAPQIRSFFLIV
jgi:hypothetical protein